MALDNMPSGPGPLTALWQLQPVRRVFVTLVALATCGGLILLWHLVSGLGR